MSYRIVKVSSFYKSFLNSYYSDNPQIVQKSFKEQYKHLMEQGYGYSDYFIHNLSNLSYQGHEIVHNAMPIQQTWAAENDFTGKDILLQQLIHYQPEVVFFQDSISFSANYIDHLREKVKSIKLIIAHICAPYTKNNLNAFRKYDFVLTCSQKFVNEFNREGLKCYLFRHAIEADLVKRLSPVVSQTNEIIFIGSLLQRKEFHEERIKYIEGILKENIPLKAYGYIENDSFSVLRVKQAAFILNKLLRFLRMNILIEKSTPLSKINLLKEFPKGANYSKALLNNFIQQELYGLKMLQALSSYSVSFNLHGQVAGDYAANVRMFEVTGAGSALLTDHKVNIKELFEPDTEIVTYSSLAECLEKSKYLIDHPEQAKEIALAGQRRTLKDHTVEKRAQQLDELIKSNIG